MPRPLGTRIDPAMGTLWARYGIRIGGAMGMPIGPLIGSPIGASRDTSLIGIRADTTGGAFQVVTRLSKAWEDDAILQV